jgi:transcriptional regulator EpsA
LRLFRPVDVALFHDLSGLAAGQLNLDDQDRLRFADVAETSFAVVNRQRFFVWTQSSVQSLIPHEILLCAIKEPASGSLKIHRFTSSRYFRDREFEAVSDPVAGIFPAVLTLSRTQRQSTVLCPPAVLSDVHVQLCDLVQTNELKNLAAHLVFGVTGQVDAIYGLSRIGGTLGPRTASLLELIAPYLHRAFLCVLAAERSDRDDVNGRAAEVITRRQAEILDLVKLGKTNAEIAQLLGCSQWTVKNHVQSILRRLESTSRTQAIARAISLGLLSPTLTPLVGSHGNRPAPPLA